MAEFERTHLGSVQRQIDSNCGFRIGDHNFGRVDTMSDDEIVTVINNATRLKEEADRLLDALDIELYKRLYE